MASMSSSSSRLPHSPSKKHSLSGKDSSALPLAKRVQLPNKFSLGSKNSSRKNGVIHKKTTGLEGFLSMDQSFVEATTATTATEAAKSWTKASSSEELIKRERIASSVPHVWADYMGEGRGLPNITAALCYRHSLIQALLHIPQFVFWLKDQHQPKYCVSDSRKLCISCNVRSLALAYWDTASMEEIEKRIVRIDSLFRYHNWKPDSMLGHGDPEEQMIWMMNKMSTEMASECFAYYHAFHQFKLQSEISCHTCGHVSKTDGDFVDFLQVPIKPRAAGDRLDGLIENYLDETVSNYTCDGCKRKADRQRIQKIAFAPDVLMITLKRFAFDRYGDLEKDCDRVNYGLDLDLSKHRVDLKQGRLTYHLRAIISHAGNTRHGHYHCIALTDEGWVEFDDSDVSHCNVAQALDPSYFQKHKRSGWTPYLLFYQRDEDSLP